MNLRHLRPERSALPGCATLRVIKITRGFGKPAVLTEYRDVTNQNLNKIPYGRKNRRRKSWEPYLPQTHGYTTIVTAICWKGPSFTDFPAIPRPGPRGTPWGRRRTRSRPDEPHAVQESKGKRLFRRPRAPPGRTDRPALRPAAGYYSL